jgi:hypothetical protein
VPDPRNKSSSSVKDAISLSLAIEAIWKVLIAVVGIETT